MEKNRHGVAAAALRQEEVVRTYETRTAAGGALCCLKPKNGRREASMAEELSRTLRQSPRSIPPKFFYDRRGSELFERICGLPEYYLTRAETEILSGGAVRRELAGFLDGHRRLVELGSGSSAKTRHILDIMTAAAAAGGSRPAVQYVPIDISEFLEESAAALLTEYPGIEITGIVDTYEGGLRHLGDNGGGGPKSLIAFFGSSFGNLSPAEGAEFLGTVRGSMGADDLFLIGLDLVKEADVLEDAYDDSQGVTARFNLNVLERINRDLGADFDPGGFEHHSVYNVDGRRVEMYLRSLRRQEVSIPGAGMSMTLERGELIHTENSQKFSVPRIREMMGGAGFEIRRIWQDPGGRFASVLASRS